MTSQDEFSEDGQVWDATDLTEETVQHLVNRRDSDNNGNGGGIGDYASQHPNECKTWRKPGNIMAPISLGDGEMTASINRYGRILQFGRYMTVNNGRTGMFIADHASTEGPWKVRARVANLQKMSMDDMFGTSYGLKVTNKGVRFRTSPEVRFVHYRWPRTYYKAGHLDVIAQCVIRNGMFVQQFTIRNFTSQNQPLSTVFKTKFDIREAEDYTERETNFDSCKSSLGPFGYSLIATLPLKATKNDDNNADDEVNNEYNCGRMDRKNRESSKDSQGKSKNKSDRKNTSTANPDSGGVMSIVAAVFVDGKAQKFDNHLKAKWKYELPASKTVQITAAYHMLYMPGSPLPWKEYIIPAEITDLDSFLRNEPFDPDFFLSIIDPTGQKSAQTDEESEQFRDGHTEKSEEDFGDGDNDYYLESVSDDKSEDRQGNGPVPDPEFAPFRADADIEYATRVKLEQILNVCAISRRSQSEELGMASKSEASASASAPATDNLESVAPVVLTCGDISTHRVHTTSSFFAFRFLVEVYKRLLTVPRSPYVEDLKTRIYQVCRGHIKWLLDLEKTANDTFGPNYSLSGRLMPKTDEAWWLADASLTDTPFHLLKMVDYVRFFKDENALDYTNIFHALRKLDKSWKADLLRCEHRKAFAWPDRKDWGVHVFRLDDHVWIWATLAAMSDPGIMPREAGDADDASDALSLNENIESSIDRFSPRDVQREMLRRFTTDNDVGTRMLALIRSPRSTRFLFNRRSTSYFYEGNRDFFYASRNLWQNTIDAQCHYDDNQVAVWDNTIRYSLAIIMSISGLYLTKHDPRDLMIRSLITLFGSVGADGFFPGQLDETTKQPVLFHDELDRDFYFQAGFEASYVLLNEARKIQEILDGPKSRQRKRRPDRYSGYDRHASENTLKVVLQAHPSDRGHDLDHPVHNDRMSLQIRPEDLTYTQQRLVTFKKHLPFNNLIDSSSIVEMNEEWIYNYPSFLGWDPSSTSDYVLDEARLIHYRKNDDTGNHAYTATETEIELDSAKLVGFVKDIPEGKHTGRRNKEKRDGIRVREKAKSKGHGSKIMGKESLSTESRLWIHLNRLRTAEDAKKRLVWLERGSRAVAFICRITSPKDEKLPLSLFFDRHATYDTYFFDTTSRVLNTWETEVHLSFYQMLCIGDHLGLEGSGGISGIPQSSIDTYRIGGSKGRTFRLTRAAMGFRFIGDIFDRYWTCHFIEYIPHVANGDRQRWTCAVDLEQIDLPFDMLSTNRSWHQRKVLELYLFERMLSQLVDSTRELLYIIRDELGVHQGAVAISVLNSDDYFSSRIQWQQFQQMLQTVEDEIESVQSDVIDKWLNREKDRGKEQPRWTRNDEIKCRGIITNLQAAIGRKLRDLQREKAKVHSLNTWLGHTQDQIRDDLGLRGAENIRFFTYVTVVFLPLGFAASIFSMSDSGPVQSVLVNMVVCAAVALAVTVVALVNAQVLASLADDISSFISQRGRETMRRSMLLVPRERHKRVRERVAKKEEDEGDNGGFWKDLAAYDDGYAIDGVASPTAAEEAVHCHHPQLPGGKPGGHSWHLLFWLAYVSVEMPARSVQRAICALAGKTASPLHAVLHVVVGLLMAPFFLISWIMQVIIFNLLDAVACFWNWICLALPSDKEDKHEYDGTSINRFMYPLESMRPMMVARDRMQERIKLQKALTELSSLKEKEKIEGKGKTVDTGVTEQKNVGTEGADNAKDAFGNV